jgi:uncharacterized protein YndB with AHSA1/START domain
MIRWPERYDPSRTHVHVSNAIDIAAPREVVWAWLVDVTSWPSWYPNSSAIQVDGGARQLALKTVFRWRTFGVQLTSQVEEFQPPERLAWTGKAPGVDVYHAWLISPTPEGSHVLTEESQLGWLARMDHALRPSRMSRGHDQWLDRLRGRAASGPPPVPR